MQSCPHTSSFRGLGWGQLSLMQVPLGVECLVCGFDILWRKPDSHLVKCEGLEVCQDGGIAALKL